MDVSLPSLLLAVVGKALLDWASLAAQRQHVCRGFLGVFGVCLAVLDSLMALLVSGLLLLGDVQLAGVRFTHYHACLLAQLACGVCGMLHWPLLLLAVLDCGWSLRPDKRPPHRAQTLAYCLVSGLIWAAALTGMLRGPHPDIGEDGDEWHPLRQYCKLPGTSQRGEVSALILLILGVVVIFCSKEVSGWGQGALWQVVRSFLHTWGCFIALLLVLLPLEVPAFLDLNVPWLSFLNSFLVGGAVWLRFWEMGPEETLPLLSDGIGKWEDLLQSWVVTVANKEAVAMVTSDR